VRRRLLSSGLAGLVLSTAVLAAGPVSPASAVTVTAAVGNQYVRDCSQITRRCGGYYQVNGPYKPGFPRSFSDRWVWRWI
jgi:hypothetical protein